MPPHTRTSRRALLSLALVTACASSARAADDAWVVRPVRLGSYYFGENINVDVLLRGSAPAVGYTLPHDTTLYLSTLPAGQPFFQHVLSPLQTAYFASFATDHDGNVYFAGRVNNGIRVGEDASGWGLGFVASTDPTSTRDIALPPLALDSHGIPSVIGTDYIGRRFFSRFDVPSASWQNQTLPGGLTTSNGMVQNVLAMTPDDRAVAAYVNSYPSAQLTVAVQNDDRTTWLNFAPIGYANPTLGLSVATTPDGRIGVAFGGNDGIHLATYDGTTWTDERIASQLSPLLPHSLAVDADGNFALAYAPNTVSGIAPLHLARRSADGTWSDESLPLLAKYASLTFDATNHPYIGAFDGTNILLAGTTLQSLLPNDFTLDGAVTAADVPAFAQAVRHPGTYLAAHTPLSTTADLVSIGDHDADVRLTDRDARAFIESLTSTPLPGLPDRAAGYLAFDQADLDPTVGSGLGNFFHTSLSTGHPYAPGDSRADISGPTPGTPDARINADDVNYLHAALLTPAPSDARLDINGDGVIDAADLHTLVHDILGTTEGDANLDGQIDADDFALVDRGFAKSLTNWSDGDFNLDGLVNQDDYLVLDTLYSQAQGFSPGFLAQRESQFGPQYVSALLASVPEPSSLFAACGLALLFLPRRRPKPQR